MKRDASAPKQVFISYARKSANEQAKALYEALGGNEGLAYLDTQKIEDGDRFPTQLANAILTARLFVAFVDDSYFRSWFCLRELRTALAPFDRLICSPASQAVQKDRALDHLVVAMPEFGGGSALLENLPATLRNTHWPKASDTERLVKLIHRGLQTVNVSIGDHLLSNDAEAIRELLLVETSLPPPRQLVKPHFPGNLTPSLQERFVGRADDLFRIHFALSTLRGEPARTAAISGAVEVAAALAKLAWRLSTCGVSVPPTTQAASSGLPQIKERLASNSNFMAC